MWISKARIEKLEGDMHSMCRDIDGLRRAIDGYPLLCRAVYPSLMALQQDAAKRMVYVEGKAAGWKPISEAK